MSLKAILFDLDGTLVDSLPLHLVAYDHALRTLGIEAPRDAIIAKCFNKVDEVAAANFGITDVAAFANTYHAKIQELLPRATPHAGMDELLTWLTHRPLKLGIGTLRIREELDAVLDRLGWRRFFAATGTRDDVSMAKPDPETFLKLIQQLNVETNESLIVGDASTDILAGQAAGIPVALFLPSSHTDFYSFDELKALRPTFTVNDPLDLRVVVEGLIKEA